MPDQHPSRHRRPAKDVNCSGVVSESLVQAHLVGHEHVAALTHELLPREVENGVLTVPGLGGKNPRSPAMWPSLGLLPARQDIGVAHQLNRGSRLVRAGRRVAGFTRAGIEASS